MAYGAGACDRFSVVHLAALVGAGLTFIIAPRVAALSHNAMGRAVGVAVGATITLTVILWLFPHCLAGPYGQLSDYLRQTWLTEIPQDGSILRHPAFISSFLFQWLAVGLLGLCAAVAIAIRTGSSNRAWLVYGLFAGFAVVQALLALRLMRVVPLLSGPGLGVLVAAVLPTLGAKFKPSQMPVLSAWMMLVPGLALIAALLALPSLAHVSRPAVTGVAIADSCIEQALPRLSWPAGSRVLAGPHLGLRVLDPEAGVNVVAVPFHTAALGVERVYRFLDAATPDHKPFLAATKATHVATCAIDAGLARQFAAEQPLAVALASGQAPPWLRPCPPEGTLRIYAVSDAISCPLPANGTPVGKRN